MARSYEHNIQSEIKYNLQVIIEGNAFLSNLISSIRLNGGMDENSFLSHILFTADVSSNQKHNTGARTIKDLLLDAGVIQEQDGKYNVTISTERIKNDDMHDDTISNLNNNQIKKKEQNEEQNEMKSEVGIPNPNLPHININLQLTIPESSDPTVYENLFKAMKKYLMSNDDE